MTWFQKHSIPIPDMPRKSSQTPALYKHISFKVDGATPIRLENGLFAR